MKSKTANLGLPSSRKNQAGREYLKLQGRFSHLTEKDIAKIQQDVDIVLAQMYNWEKSGLSLPWPRLTLDIIIC